MKLGELIQKYNTSVLANLKLSPAQQKTLRQIARCRTPDLGGHWYLCPDCGNSVLLYNSCRNRNCPTCQGNKRKLWVEKQCSELIDVPYYHLVFTVPEILNGLFLYRPEVLYNILFSAAWKTVKAFFADPKFLGGRGAMLSVLHTWGQTLSLHPHLHCLVPGAGLDKTGNFKTMRSNGKYLFPVKAMCKVFRAKFAAELTLQARKQNFKIPDTVRAIMFRTQWVVFCKRPFAKPEYVLKYLGRYTYRTAIAENRIISDHNQQISFTYKDYKNGSAKRTMSLEVHEFFRRYAMHLLPPRIIKIRHFGMLSNSNKAGFFEKAGTLCVKHTSPNTLTVPENQTDDQEELPSMIKKTNIACSCCKKGHLLRLLGVKTGLFKIVNIQTGELLSSPARDPPAQENILVCNYLFGKTEKYIISIYL